MKPISERADARNAEERIEAARKLKATARHRARIPPIYLHADVCRAELLVEILAVAFSPFARGLTKGSACAKSMLR